MAGVQKVCLNNLNINLKNALIIGIIIAKTSPRTIPSKKKNGESRGVMSFTFRDSEVDTINADIWGSEYFVHTFYDRFLVGDVVEISSPKICVKTGETEIYRPQVTSPFYLSLNEGLSDVSIFSGDNLGSYLPLLHIPTKSLTNFCGLSEVHKLKGEKNNEYIDLLVLVKSVKPTKIIKTKAGAVATVREVEIIDDTTPFSVTLDIFDTDTIQRADAFRALESVVALADAQAWRGGVRAGPRCVLTHQPRLPRARALRLLAAPSGVGAPSVQCAGAGGGEASVRWLRARLRAAAPAAPAAAALCALLTHLRLDRLLPSTDNTLEELRVRFADHTGELTAVLPIHVLEEATGYSLAQIKTMPEEQRESLRWSFLLEQCNVDISVSPPRAVLLTLRRATAADPIPFSRAKFKSKKGMEKQEKIEIMYEYTKRRKEYGRQTLFEDRNAELGVSIPSNPAMYKDYILRNPVDVSVENTKPMSEHWVNSVRAEYTTSGVNHVEGGWPKDINTNDPEATQRYRRKIEKDDAYIHAVMHLGHSMEHNILQNNAVDMYQIYYSELPAIPPVERSSCHTVNVYREPAASRRPIRSLSWQQDGARLACAHADICFMRNTRSLQLSYIWDIENANAPELIITPPQPLIDLQYNPRDQHILVGGLMNGQVGCWDMRKGGEAIGLCPPHVAHRDLARNVLFINSKTGAEFFSASPDGVVKWWDTRNMNEPTDFMIIDPVKSNNDTQSVENAVGISALEYEPTIPTRFMVGTETGLVIGGNRKGKTPLEKLPSKYEAHSGPVYALQRNPTFLKNFLTVGDWTARVWSEDCRESSIIWTPSHRTKLTDGAWNPIRFSVVMVSQADGRVSWWDVSRRRAGPALAAQLCDEPLLRLAPHQGGLLVACGSSKGTVYLAELSQNLGTADKNDKQLLTHILERENKRERILEARMRELRLKMRQERDCALADGDCAPSDHDLRDAAADYMQTVQDLQALQT